MSVALNVCGTPRSQWPRFQLSVLTVLNKGHFPFAQTISLFDMETSLPATCTCVLQWHKSRFRCARYTTAYRVRHVERTVCCQGYNGDNCDIREFRMFRWYVVFIRGWCDVFLTEAHWYQGWLINIIWRPPLKKNQGINLKVIWLPPLKSIWRPPDNFKWRPPDTFKRRPPDTFIYDPWYQWVP